MEQMNKIDWYGESLTVAQARKELKKLTTYRKRSSKSKFRMIDELREIDAEIHELENLLRSLNK